MFTFCSLREKIIILTLRPWLLVPVALFLAHPAKARHPFHQCGHGMIRRVSLGICVSTHSKMAQDYVHERFTFRHYKRHREIATSEPDEPACDPRMMCGDPVEDRVVDPVEPDLPNPFGRSIMRLVPVRHWGMTP